MRFLLCPLVAVFPHGKPRHLTLQSPEGTESTHSKSESLRLMVSWATLTFTSGFPHPCILPIRNTEQMVVIDLGCTQTGFWRMVPHSFMVSPPNWGLSYGYKNLFHHSMTSSFWVVWYIMSSIDFMVMGPLLHLLCCLIQCYVGSHTDESNTV